MLQKCCACCPASAALHISDTWQRPPGEDCLRNCACAPIRAHDEMVLCMQQSSPFTGLPQHMPALPGFCKGFSVSTHYYSSASHELKLNPLSSPGPQLQLQPEPDMSVLLRLPLQAAGAPTGRGGCPGQAGLAPDADAVQPAELPGRHSGVHCRAASLPGPLAAAGAGHCGGRLWQLAVSAPAASGNCHKTPQQGASL